MFLVVVLLGALGILAFEQVQWIDAVNRGREQRMRSELEGAAGRFTEDIDREVLSVLSALERRRSADLPARLEEWKSVVRDPRLIASIGVVSDPGARFGFDPDSLTFLVPIGDERSGQYIAIRYDGDYIAKNLIPETARRYFDGFDIAVTHGDGVVYRSNAQWPRASATADADLAWPLLLAKRRVGERGGASEIRSPWRLLVRRHGQSISQLMAAARRQDLGLAFVIDVLLAASLIILTAAIRRAERLRLQQLDFVAGITHELHTPLAALASAGQNLADSVPVDTARYGETIVREARRLTDLVDQVLQFSGIEAGASPRIENVDARAAIDEAVAECRWLARERGVEIDVASDALAIRGDRVAVTRAVQNLVA
ncbi:MAG TPA: HAMP domain-containing sensor histidine kinase, partial [Thermoanaerobaculia bacterium]|nr:HAMP domain-containing sensor histidine kinase [Thermoanaerobaculia bacterium]